MTKFYDLERATKESLENGNQIPGIWKKMEPKDISEPIIVVKKGLKVIENKIKANSFSLKEKTGLSGLVVDKHLSELEEIYANQIDEKNTWSLPLYTISNSKNTPDVLKIMALLARYVFFIKKATLLKVIERNLILEACQQYRSPQGYKLEDELNQQINKFYQLDLKSQQYRDWKKELYKEVGKIFELIQEKKIKAEQIKKEQNSNTVAKTGQVDLGILLNQKTNNSPKVNIVNIQANESKLRSCEMKKELKEKKKFKGIVNAIKHPLRTARGLMENTLRSVKKKRKGKYEYDENYSNKTYSNVGCEGTYFKKFPEALTIEESIEIKPKKSFSTRV